MELPSIVTLALYGAIALFNIICLGLLAYAVNSWGHYIYFGYRSSSPSSANFMLFNTIWTILVLVYLAVIPRVAAALYRSVVAVALLGVTTIFWFAGSVALAAFLGAGNCNDGSGFCSVYRASQAATAFGFFIWAMFNVLFVVELLGFLRNGGKAQANADMPGTHMTSQPASQTVPQTGSEAHPEA
ncbi:hypothetical protein E4U41_005670 [Claviceps citrina]|nr:hypothetical protein E4U41_005670 [Claviceps citrina]